MPGHVDVTHDWACGMSTHTHTCAQGSHVQESSPADVPRDPKPERKEQEAGCGGTIACVLMSHKWCLWHEHSHTHAHRGLMCRNRVLQTFAETQIQSARSSRSKRQDAGVGPVAA